MSFDDLSRKRVAFVMLGVMLGVLLSALDSSIVGTAMPKIIGDLKGMEHYNWPFTAYMLFSTLIIPISGKLADMFGRKIMYIWGIVIFLVASVLCGASQTMMQLIIYRGLQGLGGGIILSNCFAIVGELFSPRERGKYMGFVASMFGLASVVGPALGGIITDNYNWRWIFYINIPVGIIALATVIFALPAHKEKASGRELDFLGIITFILAIAPMLLAFTWAGNEYAWTSSTILGMFGFSLLMLAIFVYIESKALNPIIPLSLFHSRVFNVSIVAMFMTNVAMFSTIIFIPLFVQMVIGESATNSGMVITPMMLSFVLSSIMAGRMVSKTGKYKIMAIAGLVLGTGGMALLAFMDVYTTNLQVIINMIVIGLGIGVTMPIFNLTVQNAFPQRQIGVVTSAIQFFRNMGATIGSAILGSVMISSMHDGMNKVAATGLPEPIQVLVKNPMALREPGFMENLQKNISPEMLADILGKLKSVLTNSIHEVFLLSVFFVGISLIMTFFIREVPLRAHNKDEQEKAADAAIIAANETI